MYREKAKQLKEQYYTDTHVSKLLTDLMKKKVGFSKFDLIVEPSAGTGSFLKHLPNKKILAFDKYPKAKHIIKQDFLKWKPPPNFPNRNKVLCIGNPPFGYSGSLAKQFINKCTKFSDHIAFILPAPFTKANPPIGYKKVFVKKLPKDIFVDAGNNPKNTDGIIFTAFIYYQCLSKNCPIKPKQKRIVKPIGYSFLKPSDPKQRKQAHIRVVRTSGTAGRAYKKGDEKFTVNNNVKSYKDFYIKLDKPYIKHASIITDKLMEHTRKNKWHYNNTTTFYTLTRNQVARVINSIIRNHH